MPDRPSSGGREADPSADPESQTADAERDGAPESAADAAVDLDASEPDASEVDEEVQRRLREAYLNDAERELIVTGVRSADGEVVVELRTPHGDATHAERFPAPRNGSLEESEAFLAFLEAVGVSPLDVDEVVGARVPATYEGGEWRLEESYLPDRPNGDSDGNAGSDGAIDRENSRSPSAWARSRDWLWTYRYWLFAGILVGGELLFVAIVIALYG
ncbi:hypothetical protein [Halorubrum sp. CSM-61]|uniref:hypothetical protein n=1 Tax=Halorubrum sp. CSM-61 TaxID=2485838 RepID=UPI000F4B2F09|nr:hypothetical protein [Halorubrum sp. CSM-61]